MVDLAQKKRFRDAVHGDIFIYPHELLVINTKAYQRLHSIRQLDLAYKVYHDAMHTRFEHSMGATHVADRILDRLETRGHLEIWCRESNPAYCKDIVNLRADGLVGEFELPAECSDIVLVRHIVRLATLLHDVAHIPFGHMLENQLGLFRPHDEGPRLKYFLKSIVLDIYERSRSGQRAKVDSKYSLENIHYLLYILGRAASILKELAGHADTEAAETTGVGIQDNMDLEIPRNLPKPFLWVLERISSPKCLRNEEMFQADIIGNTICADLLDYVLRDNYFTGLWDKYDERIFNSFCLARVPVENTEEEQVHLALQVIRGTVRHDTISNILRILELRYDLAEKVIFHHARCASGAMLMRALQLSGLSESDEQMFYKCGDDQALNIVQDVATENKGLTGVDDKAVARLIDALQGRDLYKPYYRFVRDGDRATAHGELLEDTVGMQLFKDRDRAIRLLNDIEDMARLPRGSIVLYCPSPKMMLKETNAIVAGDDAEGFIPQGKKLRKFVHERLKVREQHIVALETRYEELWTTTFFVDPEYRAHSWLLHDLTMDALKSEFKHVPPPDPILDEQLKRFATHQDDQLRLQTMDSIKGHVIGDIIQAPTSARGKLGVEDDTYAKIEVAVRDAKEDNAKEDNKEVKADDKRKLRNSTAPRKDEKSDDLIVDGHQVTLKMPVQPSTIDRHGKQKSN